MMVDPYNPRVRQLFAAPAHAGTLAGSVQAHCDAQGVRVMLSASAANGVVDQMRYQVMACPHVIACCEEICLAVEGQLVSGLETFSAADLMQSLAVPAQKSGRIIALEDTVRQLGAALRESSSSTE